MSVPSHSEKHWTSLVASSSVICSATVLCDKLTLCSNLTPFGSSICTTRRLRTFSARAVQRRWTLSPRAFVLATPPAQQNVSGCTDAEIYFITATTSLRTRHTGSSVTSTQRMIFGPFFLRSTKIPHLLSTRCSMTRRSYVCVVWCHPERVLTDKQPEGTRQEEMWRCFGISFLLFGGWSNCLTGLVEFRRLEFIYYKWPLVTNANLCPFVLRYFTMPHPQECGISASHYENHSIKDTSLRTNNMCLCSYASQTTRKRKTLIINGMKWRADETQFNLQCICLVSRVAPLHIKRTLLCRWQIDNSCDPDKNSETLAFIRNNWSEWCGVNNDLLFYGSHLNISW